MSEIINDVICSGSIPSFERGEIRVTVFNHDTVIIGLNAEYAKCSVMYHITKEQARKLGALLMEIVP